MENCNNSRGRPQGRREVNQLGRTGRANGGVGRENVQPGREVACQEDRAQCYAFSSKNEVETSNRVIIFTIIVFYLSINVLFDPCCTYSYVSMKYALESYMICNIHVDPIHVSTLV